jgi:ferredoxin
MQGQTPPAEVAPSRSGNYARLPEAAGKHLPKFGPYLKQRQALRAQLAPQRFADAKLDERVEVTTPAKLPGVKEQIGKAIDRIGTFYDLDPKEQVVALVDEELCINCGKCYMTCNDDAYQVCCSFFLLSLSCIVLILCALFFQNNVRQSSLMKRRIFLASPMIALAARFA